MSDYGVDPKQFVRYILRPTLQRIGLWSPSAEVLCLGTALTESRLRYVDQIDKANKPGPAFGPYQIEGPTHADYYRNFLRYNTDLRMKCMRLSSCFSSDIPDPQEMWGNWMYASAMCRVHYRRIKAALPPTNDALAMAEYWKRYFNSYLGKGTVEKALPHFEFATRLII